MNSDIKNKTLRDLADLIRTHQSEIIACNKQDLDAAQNLDPTLYDRLKVDEQKVEAMAKAVLEVMDMEDPEGKVLYHFEHPNGMKVENRTVPFGLILIIYESRPDVTIEAAVNAFKAGNQILLKGGKESRNSNLFLANLWRKALNMNALPENYVQYLDVDREETQRLLRENHLKLDLIIPRGGEALIEYIRANTSVPLMVSGRGNNFIYVHEDADFSMAAALIANGKSRLSVCNAIDKVIFNANTPELKQKVQYLLGKPEIHALERYGDNPFFDDFEGMRQMSDPAMYEEEFLSSKLLFCLADSVEQAIEKINAWSGGHSAVIVTANDAVAANFQEKVDCAAVYHNASSRFTDGGQFGMGAEIAISTQKLHFRGPVGPAQLLSNKWFIHGNGQIR